MVFVRDLKSHFRRNQWIKTKLGDSVFPEVYGFPLKRPGEGNGFYVSEEILQQVKVYLSGYQSG